MSEKISTPEILSLLLAEGYTVAVDLKPFLGYEFFYTPQGTVIWGKDILYHLDTITDPEQ